MSERVDTGFDAVIAGEVWAAPEMESSLPSGESEPAVTLAPSEADPKLTATVSQPDPLAIEAMKALLGVPDIKPPALAKLAREVAMDIKERQVILKEHGLTNGQYEFLEAYNEFYKNALHAACIDWHAPLSTTERIKIEAAAIFEDSLVGLGARMQNKGEGLPGVIEAAKLFAKVAGVGEREVGGGAPGERFIINIDLGGDQKTSVSVTPVAPQLTETSSAGALPTGTEV